jgi:hypothetical protein
MFRKIALAAVAAASLGAAALVPTSASAFGPKWGPGWHPHHHWGVGLGFGPTVVVNDYAASCYQQRVVPTKKGPRLRIVDVCRYY